MRKPFSPRKRPLRYVGSSLSWGQRLKRKHEDATALGGMHAVKAGDYIVYHYSTFTNLACYESTRSVPNAIIPSAQWLASHCAAFLLAVNYILNTVQTSMHQLINVFCVTTAYLHSSNPDNIPLRAQSLHSSHAETRVPAPASPPPCL